MISSFPLDSVQVSELEIASGRVDGEVLLPKQGYNSDVDATAPEDIWDGGGTYTGFPLSAAEEFEVVSDNVNDTVGGTGARKIRLFYLDSNYNGFDANDNFLTVDVDLNGTTPSLSGVTGMRCFFARVIDSGSSEANEGTITIRWTTTTSVVFAQIQPGFSNAQITAFTVPNGWSGTLQRFSAELLDNTTNAAEIAFRKRLPDTNTWILENLFAISTGNGEDRRLWGGRAGFPAKTDLIMRVIQIDNNNGFITGSYEMRLSRNAG